MRSSDLEDRFGYAGCRSHVKVEDVRWVEKDQVHREHEQGGSIACHA